VLGESVRQNWRELESLEVVAICDHLGFLWFAQLKHEVRRKTVGVPFDLLIEPFRGHTVEFGLVRIQDDLLASNQQNPVLNLLHGNDGC
jgi:hypothetical protein